MKPLNVLVVEDSTDDTELLIYELQRGDYKIYYERVDTAPGFENALKAHPWDLVISDFSMPKFSGLAALQLVKQHGLDLPFLMLSGVINEETAVEALRAGAHDFFVKGSLARLLPAVERELHEAQQRRERRIAEKRLQLAIEIGQIGDWEWNLNTDEIRYGGFFAQLFGLEAADQAQLCYPELLHRVCIEDRAQVDEVLRHAIREHVPYTVEFRTVCSPEGEVRWLHSRGQVYQTHGDQTEQLISVVQDITERKQVETALLEKERLQIALEKEREISGLRQRFMTMAAHEFRTPLTVIASSTDILLEYYHQLSPEKQHEHLTTIRLKLRQLRQMLDEIEYVARAEHITGQLVLVPVDLRHEINKVVEEIQNEWTTPRTVEVSVSESVEKLIHLDQRLIHDILHHLLSNTYKFSTPDSRIRIDMTREYEYLHIRFTDEGIGISEEDLEHVFKPFFRGNNVGAIGGRGIGLTLVKDHVEAHRGMVTIDSVLGEGTVVTVALEML